MVLTAAFAGIALLTAVILGIVVQALLSPIAKQLQQTYILAVANDVSDRLSDLGHPGLADSKVVAPALDAIASEYGVRVRVTRLSGATVAVGEPSSAVGVDAVSHVDPLLGDDGQAVGWVEVSGVPREEARLMKSVYSAWFAASLIALVIALIAGGFTAGYIVEPIGELTEVVRRRASGELGVRANPHGYAETQLLARSSNEVADVLEQMIKQQRRFVGDAAHQLGTPLTALQADMDLAQDLAEDPQVVRLIERSQGSIERLSRIVQGLLTLSRAESSSRHATVKRPIEVRWLLDWAVNRCSPAAQRSGVLLIADNHTDATVDGDVAALGQVLDNLIENAIKYTPEGGQVKVSATRRDGQVTIAVSDTGRGIPDEDMHHVCDRFYRGSNASSVPGSGLGLAIAKAVAEAHGGRMTLDSGPAGTTVVVALPLG